MFMYCGCMRCVRPGLHPIRRCHLLSDQARSFSASRSWEIFNRNHNSHWLKSTSVTTSRISTSTVACQVLERALTIDQAGEGGQAQTVQEMKVGGDEKREAGKCGQSRVSLEELEQD
jgi:hypothetical protein